jgi:sugar phosphate isomerase/epimerase
MFGISNLAFNYNEQTKNILKKYNINNIEIAPTKICPWENFSIETLQKYINETGFNIISIQSLLYNTRLTITKPEDKEKVITHFKHIIDICEHFQIPKIVFGSPKARLLNNIRDLDNMIDFFQQIGNYSKTVKICIEPNSRKYGCNFLTNINQTIDFIKVLDNKNIKLHIDTGNMIMENDNIKHLTENLDLLESIHISNRYLGNMDDIEFHTLINEYLNKISYTKYITFESIKVDNLEQNINKLLTTYTFLHKNITTRCLVGYTGFVGKNIKEQLYFNDYYNSKNIQDLEGKYYDEIYFTAMPGTKWIANKFPEEDTKTLNYFKELLINVKTNKFILISTIDVYDNKDNTDELYNNFRENHTYGKNRLNFEKYIQQKFNNHMIIRLPGLFGKYLKKNLLYDLINQNNLHNINLNDKLQWYDMKNIISDIKKYNDYKLINFVSDTIVTKDIINLTKYKKSYFMDVPCRINYNINSIITHKTPQKIILDNIKQYFSENMYNIYFINSSELPILHTHYLCLKKLMKGFGYHGYNVYEVQNLDNLMNQVSDSKQNIFFYSNQFLSINNSTDYLIYLKRIANKFQESIHIGWCFQNLAYNNEIPFKKFIFTGEYFCNTPGTENHLKQYKFYQSIDNYQPLKFGVDANPFDIKVVDKSNWKYKSCFVGTPYKMDWSDKLDNCFYFSCNHNQRFMVGSEKSHYYNNSLVMLGFHSDTNILNGVVVDRIFEGFYHGCIVLTDSPAAVKLTNGIAELVTSVEDTKLKINYYINNENARNEKIKLGYEYLKNAGTYYHSAKCFIEKIKELNF